MKAVYILIVSIFLFASCSDVKKSSQLDTIDKMTVSIDSLSSILKKNEADSAYEWSQNAESAELRIKNYFVADTFDQEFSKDMNTYKVMRRALAKLPVAFSNLELGYSEAKESLRQLRYDIENGDGDRSKYIEYLNFETKKVADLKVMTNEYVQASVKEVENYKKLHPKIDAFSMELYEKNKK